MTWVTCANRYDVDALSTQQRACAFPCQQVNRFHIVKPATGAPDVLSNGTVSLALKHKLASFDMLQRNLSAALVLEDDAVLPLDLWGAMARVLLPPTAQIFWMGSYSRRTNVGTLADHRHVRLVSHAAPLSTHAGPSSGFGGAIDVYRRDAGRFPVILGAVSYVVYASGARIVSSEPVTTAADIAISYFPRHGVISQARTMSTAEGATTGANAGPLRSIADGSCESQEADVGASPERPRTFVQRTPSEQYGPKEWIIWPMPPDQRMKEFGDNGATHVRSDKGALQNHTAGG